MVPQSVLTYLPDGNLGVVEYPIGELNARWLDIGLVRGGPGLVRETSTSTVIR